MNEPSKQSMERARALVAAGLYGDGGWADEEDACFNVIVADIALALDEARAEMRRQNLPEQARNVVELAQLQNPVEGVPGYWVPEEAINMLRAALEEGGS